MTSEVQNAQKPLDTRLAELEKEIGVLDKKIRSSGLCALIGSKSTRESVSNWKAERKTMKKEYRAASKEAVQWAKEARTLRDEFKILPVLPSLAASGLLVKNKYTDEEMDARRSELNAWHEQLRLAVPTAPVSEAMQFLQAGYCICKLERARSKCDKAFEARIEAKAVKAAAAVAAAVRKECEEF